MMQTHCGEERRRAPVAIPAALLLVTLLGTLVGCASTPLTPTIDAARLLDGEAVFGARGAALTLPDDDIATVSDEMVAYLEEIRGDRSNPYRVIDDLVKDLFAEEGRGMVYDQNRTLTAVEAFEEGRGNCLTYSNLLVAFSRELGLDAEYREVEMPPTWDETEADIYLYDQHVNVMIGHGRTRRVFDVNAPGGIDAMLKLHSWGIPDQRAFAQYYSNLGVNFLIEDELVDAFRYFKKAHLTDPTFLPVWVNLGILYRRAGKPAFAEAAYYQVLSRRHNDYAALSNLARLYRVTGDTESADMVERRVEKERLRNPYFRYRLALDAFDEGDYATAKRHLLASIRQLGDEPRLFLFLGAVNLQLEKADSAESNFRHAAKLADSEEERERLSNKAKVLRDLVEHGYRND